MKINIDREPISSEKINSKQNFTKVLNGVKKLKVPIWKSKWFYGAIGMASIGGVVLLTSFDDNEDKTSNTKHPLHDNLKMASVSYSDNSKSEAREKVDVIKDTRSKVEGKANQIQAENQNINEIVSSKEIESIETDLVIVELDVVETEVEEVETVSNPLNLPSFNDVYTGEVTLNDLKQGMFVNSDIKVLSFKLRYTFKGIEREAHIIGNRIPNDILENISSGETQMLFFTNVFVVNDRKQEFHVPSMNLKPMI